MCDPRALEALRIDAGIPAMGAELTADTIPGEAGAEVIARSVSFTKGCYTGQELVARIDSRGGRTPRRLAHVVVDGPVPPVGAPVALDGAGVGVVTSAAPAGPPPASAPGPTATSGRAVALVSVVRGLETPVAVVVDPAGAASAGLVTELDAPAARAAATDGTVTEPGGGTG
jgi:tRNA-modifying protein YgfZ